MPNQPQPKNDEVKDLAEAGLGNGAPKIRRALLVAPPMIIAL
jgi:hypothetical protein